VQTAVSCIPRDPFVVSLIDAINLRHGTSYHLLTPTDAGESRSANLLEDRDGKRFILKFGYGVDFKPEFAARVTTRLRVLGYPAPVYAEIGEHDRWTYAVQEQLPGVPGRQETFTHSILEEAIELNRMHRLREPPNNDWHVELCRSVLVGYETYCRVDSLRTHSAETLRVLNGAQQAAATPWDNSSPTCDIVHWDFNQANILIEGEHITGVIDWEGARVGDACFDLVTLLFYGYREARVRARLLRELRERSGGRAIRLYVAHMIVRQVDWSIRNHTPDHVAYFLKTADRMLRDLATLT
jgi:aminoglycoside phosphotransferase (APT) family kinase protein